MAITFATLTVDPNTLVDADPTAPVVVTVRTNTGGAIIDADANKIFLGTASEKTTSTVTFSLPVTNGASNPTNFQYAVAIRYMETQPDGKSERKTWDSGWFSFTATANLADIATEQYVPPTWMTTATALLQTYVDSGQAAAAASAAGAQSSAASVTLAQTLVTSDLGTTDGQTRALIEDINSQTSGAIAARFGTLWLPASQMILSVGSPVAAQYGGDPYWQLPDVTPSEVSGSVNIPDGWATADLTVVWFQESIGGNVLLRSKTRSYVTAGDVGYAPWADSAGGVGTTAGAYKIVRTHVGTGIAVTPGPRLFSIYRDPTDAADYLAGSIGVLGIQIDRAS